MSSFTLSFGNVDMFHPPRQRRRAIRRIALRAHLFGLNEAVGDGAFVRALAGWLVFVGKGAAAENVVGWRPDTFTRLAVVSRLVMVGGRRGSGARGDRRRRGPSRGLAGVVLRHNASGKVIGWAKRHDIAKADTGAKWRRVLRAIGFRGYARTVAQVMEAHKLDAFLIAGDTNTIRAADVKWPGLTVTEIPLPATIGRLHYDRLYVVHRDPLRPQVSVSAPRTFRTTSDHLAVRVRVSL